MKVMVEVGEKIKVLRITQDDVFIGVNSGQPFKNQWIFIDKDDMSRVDAHQLAFRLMHEEKLRRVIIVASSPNERRWHILSFSPKTYKEAVRILHEYDTDVKHLAKMQDNGFATVRVTEKNGSEPKLVTIMNNDASFQQLNFYDYDSEKAYLKLIGGDKS